MKGKSVADIKKREVKGKNKSLPKLYYVLKNPYKFHCPVPPEDDMLKLRRLLQSALEQSGQTQKSFATKSNIKLGLESSMRAINGSRFSCVFVSLTIKPSHLIRLIASSAAAKISTAPVFAQPKLEELTHELFGIRALIMVLPLDLNAINADLALWVLARQNPKKRQQVLTVSATKKRKSEEATLEPQNKIAKPEVVKMQAAESLERDDWSGDYISCSNSGVTVKMDAIDMQTETKQLDAALLNLALKAQSKAPPAKACEVSKASHEYPAEQLAVDKKLEPDCDRDTFFPLDVYHPLTMLQVRPNPNKRPKKKRSKQQKQNKSN